MRRERMPQRVAGGPLGQARPDHRRPPPPVCCARRLPRPAKEANWNAFWFIYGAFELIYAALLTNLGTGKNDLTAIQINLDAIQMI